MAQFLETIAPEGDWRSIFTTYDLSTVLDHGELYKLNNTVGVVFVHDKINALTGCQEALTVEYGEDLVLIYQAEKMTLPKAAGVALNVGQAVYWDGVSGNGVTGTWQTGYLWIGIVTQDAAAGDARVQCDLHGNHPLAEEAP